MSQSSASRIFQDSFGFMWIGTQNGLNFYDGSDFHIYEKSLDGITGLTNGQIEDIYECNENKLLIATGKGLNIYDRKLDQIKPYPFIGEGKTLAYKHYRTLSKSGDLIWLGTINGLFRYNTITGDTKKLLIKGEKEELINRNYAIKVAQLENNRILLVTQIGIYILNQDLQILSESIEENRNRNVYQLNTTDFIIGQQNGDLLELNVATDNVLTIKKTNITNGYPILCVAEGKNGDYWIGSENGGLFIYSKSTGKIVNHKTNKTNAQSITSNSIWTLYRSKDGVMWMGPFKKGLSFYDSEYYKFPHITNNPYDSSSISNDNINCFIEDEDENLWIGTDGGGLNYWNRKTNSFEEYSLNKKNFNSNLILTLFQDSKNQLWVGNWEKGITIFNTRNKKYEVLNKENSFLLSNNVIGFIEDNNGQIWITTLNGGIQVYNPKTKKHKTINLKHKDHETLVTSTRIIFKDKNSYIWIGTETAGLYKLIKENNEWGYTLYNSLEEKRILSNDFVNTIMEDSNGTLWVGTQAGLNKYNEATDSFQIITKKDGLTNDAIKGIVEDHNGLLWLSTGNGMIHYNTTTKETLNYNETDGLQGNEFNANSFYKTRQNEIVFGGSNGFNIFLPENIKKRDNKPTVIIENLKIFNTLIEVGDESQILKQHINQIDTLTLAHNHSVINFEFVALTFNHPEKVNYAYYLDEFETDWNYIGTKNSATYTNLSPGNYTLHIKSSNSDGVWNENEKILHIVITPPFWQTWWFRLSILLLLVLCVYLIHYIRIRNIKKRQILLVKKIDERTKQLQLQKKKLKEAADKLIVKNEEIQRFTFAVSHDLKSPLSGIKGIAALIPMEYTMKDFPELDEYLEMINISCDTMTDLIEDITKIAKIGKVENKNEVLDMNKILKLSTTLVKGKLNISNIKIEIDDKNKDHIQFLVSDNGSGMDEKSLNKLFTPFERFHNHVAGTGLGLYMIKQIIESHDGNISAKSKGKGKGTTFIINLPNAITRQKQDNTIDVLVENI